ncbi:metal-dependent hydrolase [Sphingomicrobium arenosum]|uniref:metal-dependent hydrolase n=1 Tax=Sphingomicrobium arenosum TaxID=2233861 RepID=UPI00223F0F4D|nr:metal-dependent hydrolase [Sphingomicrobium arenosum]
MDNVTHSLAGALLGQMGLKRLTPRAMPTLIIAANLPDVDAVAVLMGTEHLAIRRGLTHGPIAMLVLPILLTLIVWAWDKWRPGREAVKPGWLLLLAIIGTLSHPILDWLNVYGIRFLEPFSERWFYGDTLFIIDIWVWGMLVFGVWVSRSLEKRGSRLFARPAWLMFLMISAYIAGNGWITGSAERQGRELVGKQWRIEPGSAVAAPVPMEFWRREIIWRGGGLYGFGGYRWPQGVLLSGQPQFVGLNHPLLRAARGRSDVEAYLFWSRMPVVIERDGRVLLADQRFLDPRVSDSFTIDLGAAE